MQELYKGSLATLLSGEQVGLCMPGSESTKKAIQVCWGNRGSSLERGILRLGFDGCIGVLEFNKGENSFWEWSRVYND